MSWLVSPHALQAVRALYLLVAVAGSSISLYVGWDCHRDLLAHRRLGVNGVMELLGRVNRRDALAVNLPLHLLFLALGLIAASSAPPRNLALAELISIAFAAVQGSAVTAQVLNQLARMRVRRAPHST